MKLPKKACLEYALAHNTHPFSADTPITKGNRQGTACTKFSGSSTTQGQLGWFKGMTWKGFPVQEGTVSVRRRIPFLLTWKAAWAHWSLTKHTCILLHITLVWMDKGKEDTWKADLYLFKAWTDWQMLVRICCFKGPRVARGHSRGLEIHHVSVRFYLIQWTVFATGKNSNTLIKWGSFYAFL